MRLASLLAALPAASLDADAASDADAIEIGGISLDSREVSPGDLFCCVPGFTVDGHEYAAAAAAAGAAALLVERAVPDVQLPQLRVPSVRDAMGPAAAAVFGDPSRSVDVVGVTGTNGKTTTAFMVAAICDAAGIPVGLTGTIETRLGSTVEAVRHTTPEAPEVHRLLARMRDAGCRVAAMEVSSHALDQGRVGGVHFRVGAFTNLTQDHLDYHVTLDEYFAAKARLFERERSQVAVVNVADPYGRRIAAETTCDEVHTYDAHGGDAEFTARTRRVAPSSLGLSLSGPFGTFDVTLGIGGVFNASNAACAAAVAHTLGIGPEAISAGLAAMRAVPGRFEPVDAGQDFGVVVDYAHTPDGVAHVLDSARAVAPDGSVIVVLGCGGDRDRAKRPLMGEAAASRADHVVVTSDNPRSESPEAIIVEMLPGVRRGTASWEVEVDRRRAIRAAIERARPGDIVVIAGKGHETGQESHGVITPFDDRSVAREELLGVRR